MSALKQTMGMSRRATDRATPVYRVLPPVLIAVDPLAIVARIAKQAVTNSQWSKL